MSYLHELQQARRQRAERYARAAVPDRGITMKNGWPVPAEDASARPAQPSRTIDPPRLPDTLASFAVGAGNRLAVEVARTLSSGDLMLPVTFHGMRCGKTHLLKAIVEARNAIEPASAEYISPFDPIPFEERALIAFDDVDRRPKEMGLVSLFGRAQIVTAMMEHPAHHQGEWARWLTAGLAVEIGRPDARTRRAIVANIAARFYPGWSLSEDVAARIGELVDDVDVLSGVVHRLHVEYPTEASLDAAESIIAMLPRRPAAIPVAKIQAAVARRYLVSKTDLLSQRRTRTVVRPRQIAMYLAKTMTEKSLPDIGRRFGGRDHTTVLHAVRKFEGLRADDPAIAAELDELERALRESP